MRILTGRKVILIPMQETDFDFFMEVYTQQKKNFLYDLGKGTAEKIKENFLRNFYEGIFYGWIIFTNHGRKAAKIGTIWAMDNNEFTMEISGALSAKMVRGTISRIRRKNSEGYTYAEEALFLVTQYCILDLGKERIQAAIEDGNTLAIELTKKVGFKKEGTLRNFVKMDDKKLDIVMLSMLKEDF